MANAEDTQHASAIRGYSSSLLYRVLTDLQQRHAHNPRDHEQRWIIKRRKAVQNELQRRKA